MAINPLWLVGANALASALAARGAARAGGMVIPASTQPTGLISPRMALAANIGTNVASALWARHMSNTAHRRQVEDLKKAGINPMLTAGGRGASSDVPSFESPVTSALAARQAQANIELTNAQAHLVRTQAGDISSSFQSRMGLMEEQAAVARMSVEQARATLPEALNRARAEIAQMSSAAQANQARAVLDQLQKTSAENLAQFEKRVGEMGPAMRFFFELLRAARGFVLPGQPIR